MLRHPALKQSQMEHEDMMEHLFGTSLWNICSLLPSTSFHFVPLRSTSVLVTLCAQEAVGHLLSGRFVTPVTTVTPVTPGFRLRTDGATGTAPGQWLGRIAEASPQRHVPSWKVQTKGLTALCENM